jgi:chromosome segregation ATPase
MMGNDVKITVTTHSDVINFQQKGSSKANPLLRIVPLVLTIGSGLAITYSALKINEIDIMLRKSNVEMQKKDEEIEKTVKNLRSLQDAESSLSRKLAALDSEEEDIKEKIPEYSKFHAIGGYCIGLFVAAGGFIVGRRFLNGE